VTTGRDLRSAREAKRVGLGRLAELTGRDKGHLSRVERGEREVTPALVRDYERVLSIDVFPASDLSAGDSPASTVDDMLRRSLLGAIAAASMGAATGVAIGRLLDAIDGLEEPVPSYIGLAEVEAVEAAADLYTRMDLARGGGLATTMATSSLKWSSRLLHANMSSTTRQRLCSAVGLLADRLGWSLYDAGHHTKARELLSFALDTAAKGADRDLRAHIMLDLSTVVTDAGDPGDGVEILRLALGDERISAAERANLHAVCARHCGTAGDTQAGLRHVALAEEALARGGHAEAPDWARRITVSKGHHDSALGLALFTLGEDRRARDRLTAALDALDHGRTRTGLRCRTRLAVLHLRDGARSEGESEARRAAHEASGVRSRRVDQDLTMMIRSTREAGLSPLADDLTATLARTPS
jgi:transcriptional regulator with XRE-family HTH domain